MFIHDPHKPVYTISVAAELLSVHPRTLRIYEEEGLIRPHRSWNNNRMFSAKDIEILKSIRYLLHERGLNLAGVKALLLVAEKIHLEMDQMMNELMEL